MFAGSHPPIYSLDKECIRVPARLTPQGKWFVSEFPTLLFSLSPPCSFGSPPRLVGFHRCGDPSSGEWAQRPRG